jgi:uncharacterized iron-regulated membrane protein
MTSRPECAPDVMATGRPTGPRAGLRARAEPSRKSFFSDRRAQLGRWHLVALVAVILVGGCSVRVSVGQVNDEKFLAAWQSGWQAVDRASQPLNPTSSSPGVCNEGGSAAGCVQTGEAMLPALTSLRDQLSVVQTPSSFSAASSSIQSAIGLDINAIDDRDTAISTRDGALFTKAVGELKQAAQAFSTGYAEFPQANRPTPAPFDGGLSG